MTRPELVRALREIEQHRHEAALLFDLSQRHLTKARDKIRELIEEYEESPSRSRLAKTIHSIHFLDKQRSS